MTVADFDISKGCEPILVVFIIIKKETRKTEELERKGKKQILKIKKTLKESKQTEKDPKYYTGLKYNHLNILK